MTRDDTERETDEEETAVYPPSASTVAAEDDPSVDEDDEWGVRGPARGIRLRVPTAGLLAAVLIAGGFWGGAVVEKGHGSSATGSGAASAFAARFRRGATGATGAAGATGARGAGGFAGGGFGGFGGAGAAAATGTISIVTGKTLYILTAAGALVKVTLAPSTTITRDAATQADGLRPGDTAIVQGTTATNGDVSATSVSATAPTTAAAG